MRRYDRAWYAAVAGWGFAFVLSLGLITAFWLKPLPDEPGPEAGSPLTGPPGGGLEETPPHHIT